MSYIEKLEESVGKLGGIQRIQYNYFKYVMAISSGFIFVIIGFLEKILTKPQPIGIYFAYFSIVSFAISMIFSFFALPNTANIEMYVEAIKVLTIYKDKENEEEERKKIETEFEKLLEKISDAVDSLGYFDKVSRWAFVLGVLTLLISMGIYFIN